MVLGNYSQFNMLGMDSSMGYQNFFNGGFGMGNFGMGSIFGSGFGGCNMFQNCDGSYNYNAMAGMAIGGVLVNCLFGFLGQVAQNRQANKAEALKNSPDTLISNYNTQITAQLKKLGDGATESNYNQSPYSVVTDQQWYKTKKSAIDSDRTNQESIITTAQNDILDSSTLSNNNAIIAAFDALPAGDAKRSDANEIQKYNDAKTAVEKHTKAEAAIEAANKELDKIRIREDALTTEAEQKQEEINGIISTIKDLINSRNEQVKLKEDASNEAALDKADGHGWQQTKEADYKAKFGTDNKLLAGAKVTKSDLRFAIQGYRNAKNDKNKNLQGQYALQALEIWNNLSEKDRSDSSLKAAIKIIMTEQN